MKFCITESKQEMKMLLAHNIIECLSYLIPGGEIHDDLYIGNIDGDLIKVGIKDNTMGNWFNYDKMISGNIIELWNNKAYSYKEAENLITKWLSERIIEKYSYLDENSNVITYIYLVTVHGFL